MPDTAAHLLEGRYDIRTVQELLGDKEMRTIVLYAYVLNPGGEDTDEEIHALSYPSV